VLTLELGVVLNPLTWWIPSAQWFCDYCSKYSPFILPLFVGVEVEVDEGPEFTTCPTNGGFECIWI